MTQNRISDVLDAFISNVRFAMKDSDVGALAEKAEIDERRLRRILNGHGIPDLAEVRALELALDADLWPESPD